VERIINKGMKSYKDLLIETSLKAHEHSNLKEEVSEVVEFFDIVEGYLGRSLNSQEIDQFTDIIYEDVDLKKKKSPLFKKDRYTIVIITPQGKKIRRATSQKGILDVVHGKKNFKILDSNKRDITTKFKQFLKQRDEDKTGGELLNNSYEPVVPSLEQILEKHLSLINEGGLKPKFKPKSGGVKPTVPGAKPTVPAVDMVVPPRKFPGASKTAPGRPPQTPTIGTELPLQTNPYSPGTSRTPAPETPIIPREPGTLPAVPPGVPNPYSPGRPRRPQDPYFTPETPSPLIPEPVVPFAPPAPKPTEPVVPFAPPAPKPTEPVRVPLAPPPRPTPAPVPYAPPPPRPTPAPITPPTTYPITPVTPKTVPGTPSTVPMVPETPIVPLTPGAPHTTPTPGQSIAPVSVPNVNPVTGGQLIPTKPSTQGQLATRTQTQTQTGLATRTQTQTGLATKTQTKTKTATRTQTKTATRTQTQKRPPTGGDDRVSDTAMPDLRDLLIRPDAYNASLGYRWFPYGPAGTSQYII